MASSIVKPAPVPVTTPSWEPKFERFVDLKQMDFALRYRSVSDSNGAHEYSQAQNRTIVDGKFKFDSKGKYGVVFHASTGHYFNWAYADFMGGGTKQAKILEAAKMAPSNSFVLGIVSTIDAKDVQPAENSGGWAMYVRRLYLDVEPIEGVEAQYGSLDIDRGASSEITSYDNDGWITGERISIRRPHNFFFDEISATYAEFGDLYKPNFFERASDLKKSNYHQFLLRKKAFHRVDTSFDYTWEAKANTFRQGMLLDTKESRVFDSFRFEAYQRTNETGWAYFGFSQGLERGHGYAVTVDKKLGSRVALEAGMANIDLYSVILTQTPIAGLLSLGINGDQYGVGKRFFAHPTLKLTPYLEATAFYTHTYSTQTGGNQTIWNQQALNAGLVFDMKKALFPKSRVQ